jgi:hypothetical protein
MANPTYSANVGTPYGLITSAAATPVLAMDGGVATYLVGVVNNSLSAQTVTFTVYDSTGAASGTIVASIGPLGISQVITFPGLGIYLKLGCVVVASGAPIAPGVQFIVR